MFNPEMLQFMLLVQWGIMTYICFFGLIIVLFMISKWVQPPFDIKGDYDEQTEALRRLLDKVQDAKVKKALVTIKEEEINNR